MILSDREIRGALDSGHLGINPLEDWQIQPASIDLTMDWPPKIYENSREGLLSRVSDPDIFDPINPQPDNWKFACPPGQTTYLLKPGVLLLASTREYLRVGNGYGAHINGLSSLGRMGLNIHASCSWFDPGFQGNAVLELLQTGGNPIRLRPGMRICQLLIHTVSSPSLRPYGHPDLKSKYLGQQGPVGAL